MRGLVRRSTLGAVVGVALLAVPTAASAADPGNSGAAMACLQGGYLNYATTAATKFQDTGGYVSYAANGGALVPLPDLVPMANCTSNSSQVDCSFQVRNIGIAPAAGQIELQAALTITATNLSSLTGVGTVAGARSCGGSTSASTSAQVDVNPVGTADASVTCNNITIQPGATANLMEVDVGGVETGSHGTIAVSAGIVTPILENSTNNTFSQTFTVTGM
jgi:hypothetical protein